MCRSARSQVAQYEYTVLLSAHTQLLVVCPAGGSHFRIFVPPNAECARPDETGGGDGDSDGSSGALQCDGMGWEWERRRRSPRHKFVLKFNPNSLLNVARSRGALHRCVKSNSPLLHSQPLWPPPPLSPLLYSPPLSSPLLNSSPLWNWGRGAARRGETRLGATRRGWNENRLERPVARKRKGGIYCPLLFPFIKVNPEINLDDKQLWFRSLCKIFLVLSERYRRSLHSLTCFFDSLI